MVTLRKASMESFRLSGFAIVGLAAWMAAASIGCRPTEPVERTETEKQESTATKSQSETAATNDGEHSHVPGAHGGIIVSLGRDSYHLEAVFEQGGKLSLYTLGADETRVIDVEAKEWSAFVRRQGDERAVPIVLRPKPQEGDQAGRASLFVGQLPDELANESVQVTVSPIVIDGERFRASFTSSIQTAGHDDPSHSESGHGQIGADESPAMPEKVMDSAESDLYLTPAGRYTLEDIEANGRLTASQKFKGIRSVHDMKPKAGDRICPVTQTKANPAFEWVIGGERYLFCCPPCVDEFLKQAKEDPDSILPAESYVKMESSNEE